MTERCVTARISAREYYLMLVALARRGLLDKGFTDFRAGCGLVVTVFAQTARLQFRSSNWRRYPRTVHDSILQPLSFGVGSGSSPGVSGCLGNGTPEATDPAMALPSPEAGPGFESQGNWSDNRPLTG